MFLFIYLVFYYIRTCGGGGICPNAGGGGVLLGSSLGLEGQVSPDTHPLVGRMQATWGTRVRKRGVPVQSPGVHSAAKGPGQATVFPE